MFIILTANNLIVGKFDQKYFGQIKLPLGLLICCIGDSRAQILSF